MEDLKAFLYVVVDGEDLLQEQIEVEEKPALITQDRPTQYGNERAGTSESTVRKNNSHRDFQIKNVLPKAECFFVSENNNDSVSTIYSENKKESEVLNPLQSHFDMERNESVKVETIDNVEIIPTIVEKDNFDNLETNIHLFTPYIRKFCGSCKRVTELVTDTLSNKKCNICKKLVTTYCCVLCLEIKNLNDMYIHIFKCHYDETTSSNVTIRNISVSNFVCNKCGVHYVNKKKLREHESNCTVPANLFCTFCPVKMSRKREMREHMINNHKNKFNMSLLENILDEIVREADAVISLMTQHKGHCTTCKKEVPLTYPLHQCKTYCTTCSTKLVYYCKDPGSGCSSQPFIRLSSLQLHLRYHANKGWTRKCTKYSTIRICHLCGYEDEKSKLKAHMLSKHRDIFLCKCDLCGINLKNISAWKRHQTKYCPVTHEKLQCGHCWFMCFKKRRLRRHLKSVHTHLYTGKRPQCNKCGITWAGLYRLRWHESKCSGDFKVERAKQRELWATRGVVTLS